MVVRIRFAKPPSPSEKRLRNQRLALVFATLLQPPAVAALALALWRICANFKWVASFAIPDGPFSHWQTWIARRPPQSGCAPPRSTVMERTAAQAAV